MLSRDGKGILLLDEPLANLFSHLTIDSALLEFYHTSPAGTFSSTQFQNLQTSSAKCSTHRSNAMIAAIT
jgi:hypothetical protein